MNTYHKSLVALHLESGFYTAYQDSHGASLEVEDLENDYIERDWDKEEEFEDNDNTVE